MIKILFITKFREISVWDGSDYSIQKYNSGVFLSSQFIVDGLNKHSNIEAVLEKAIDNNCIDRLVTEHKPDIVILEAFWVVPEKFDELLPLHPNVKWVIRNHSAMPFIAEEGIIMDWSLRYTDYDNVYIGLNNFRTFIEFSHLLEDESKALFLPNYYPVELIKNKTRNLRFKFKHDGELHVGCFGALRPLKNNLTQAYSAIRVAKDLNRKLYFHINCNRADSDKSPILKNLISLFDKVKDVELVIHEWMSHEDFYNLCGTMDIGLQVSFSETFNIVAADFVANDVPLVGSDEISFISKYFKADMNDTVDIIKKMKKALQTNCLTFITDNGKMLKKQSLSNLNQWKQL